MGYKCDKCELNYFQNRATHQCEECPACYGLVKKQVSRKNESAFGQISILHLYLWAVAESTDADIKSKSAKSLAGGLKGQQELVEDFHLQVFKDLIAKHDYI